MTSRVDRETLMKIIEEMAKVIEENEKYLTELDSVIGDGDHGVNLSRGFQAVTEKTPSLGDKDVQEILNEVGSTLLETVGGSVGVLYGSALMEAGKALGGKTVILLDDLVRMVDAAEQAIRNLGHADVGEKTMLDTIHPFAKALRAGSEQGLTLVQAVDSGVRAAKEGLESTKDMIARRGRAKYLGEKTIGHQDVGATSSYLMMKSLSDTLKKVD